MAQGHNQNAVTSGVPRLNELSGVPGDTVRGRLERRHDKYASHLIDLLRHKGVDRYTQSSNGVALDSDRLTTFATSVTSRKS